MDKRTLWILLAVVTLAVALLTMGPVSLRARAAKKDRSAVGLAGRRAGSINEAGADTNTDDPDLPAFLNGKIDKEQYLQMRERYLNRLRGVPYDLPYDPRVRAIREMERQETSLGLDTRRGTQRIEAARGVEPQLSSTSWTAIGPAPIPNGQTVGVLNPVSGRVTAIAVNPVNPNIAYVGAAQGGVYRTLDGGATWASLFDNALTLSIGAIAISPINPTTVFVGTGERNHSGDSFFGVGVYVIKNAETTADLVGPLNLGTDGSNVLSGNSISKILVSPLDDNSIFVATGSAIGGIGPAFPVNRPSSGLYRSTNALSSAPVFTRLPVPAVPGRATEDMVFEPQNPNNMLCAVTGLGVAGDGGIWRTTNALDAAPVFTQVLTLGTANTAFRAALAINKIGSTVTVVAADGEKPPASSSVTCPASSSGTLRASTDGGMTWSDPVPGANGFCGGQCSYDIVVAIDPNQPNRIYLGGPADGTCSSALKRSIDGKTFIVQSQGLHADTHAIAIAPSNPSIIYEGNDGGIFKSTDGGDTWASLNNSGFNATQFQSLALHPVDPNFLIGGTQDNGTEIFGSDRNWVHGDFGDGGFAVMDQNSADTSDLVLYHTYFNVIGTLTGFSRSTSLSSAVPNGWKFFGCQSDGVSSNGINCDDSAVEFYAPLAVGPGNPSPVYFGTDRLYRSAKLGKKMKQFSQGPIVSGVPISSIGIAPTDDNVRLVGLDDGEVFAVTDGSKTLTSVTSDSFPFDYVSRTVIDPKDSNTAYVTFSGFGDTPGQHVWKTTNLKSAAVSWTPAGNGIPDVPVNAFAIDPANSLNLYAGTDIGVYRSTDGGSTWVPFSEGLPRVAVFDLAIQPRTGVIRIATHGRGIWERARP
ncbi:MAG TPA: hypothetical protein VN345_07295 [Blastocatellia bacterium]|nr:hypothetical protein [Blastocatellia bacterium]